MERHGLIPSSGRHAEVYPTGCQKQTYCFHVAIQVCLKGNSLQERRQKENRAPSRENEGCALSAPPDCLLRGRVQAPIPNGSSLR